MGHRVPDFDDGGLYQDGANPEKNIPGVYIGVADKVRIVRQTLESYFEWGKLCFVVWI